MLEEVVSLLKVGVLLGALLYVGVLEVVVAVVSLLGVLVVGLIKVLCSVKSKIMNSSTMTLYPMLSSVYLYDFHS